MSDQKPAAAPSSEELAALIEADRQARAEAARAEIAAVCERYRVQLQPTVTIIGDRLQAGMTIVPA